MARSLLLADDSVTFHRVVEMCLSQEDVTVIATKSADEALAKARDLRPDIVVADSVMPGKSGYDLAAALKSDPSLAHIPVLILASATEGPPDENRWRAARADGAVPKPFQSGVFIEQVKALLAGAKPGVTQPGPARAAVAAAAPAARPATPPAPAPAARPPVAGAPTQPAPVRPAATQPPPARPVGAPAAAAPRPAVPGATQPPPARPAAPPAAAAARPAAPPPGAPSIPPVPRPAGAVPAARPAAPGPVAAPALARPAAPAAAPARAPVPGAPTQPAPPRPAAPAAASQPPAARPAAPAPAARPVAPPPAPAPVAEKLTAENHEALLREALTKASREMIEKIIWEVVPELAEVIIKEEVQKALRAKGQL